MGNIRYNLYRLIFGIVLGRNGNIPPVAAGLFIAPYICGYEPKYQKLGVDALFGALLVVVLGSMAGQWASVMHKLVSGDLWFWFDHQGYEYVDLGRVWQIALLMGYDCGFS